MPWTVKDVDEHKKGLTEAEKKKWVSIANSVRKTCIADGGSEKTCDAKAIRIANSKFSINMEDSMYRFTIDDVEKYQLGWLSKGQKEQWLKFANEAFVASEAETDDLKKEEAILSANTKLSSTVPTTALMFIANKATLTFEKSEEEEEKLKLDMVGYSGGVIKDHWWWGDLVIDLGGVQFNSDKLPILENHNTDRKLAFTGKPIIDKDGIKVDSETTVFLDNEYSNEFIKNSKAGFPYQSSIYVEPLSIERLEKDAEVEVNGFTMKGPGTVFRKTELKEISACVFGWDSNTTAAAFSQTLSAETKFVASNNSSGQVPDNDLNTKKNKNNINLEDDTMDLAQLKKDHPDLYAQVMEEGKTAAETSFSSKEQEMKDEIATMQAKISSFEKNEIIRSEKEMQNEAKSLFASKLAESDIPEHLHEKVMPHVQYTKFVEEGKFDKEAFSTAVDAEIKSWIDAGITSSVMGSSFSKEPEADIIARKEKLEQEIDADVDTLLSIVQTK